MGIDEMTKMTIFHAKRLIWRGFSSLSSNPLCVCIVGCGTAGFYTAEIDLSRIYSAREFVWWYNGHPDHSNLAPDLKTTDTAIILGQLASIFEDLEKDVLTPSTLPKLGSEGLVQLLPKLVNFGGWEKIAL